MVIIRDETKRRYGEGFARPMPAEIKEVIRWTGMSGSEVSRFLGISNTRTVRKWISGELPGPSYSQWRLLLMYIGEIEADVRGVEPFLVEEEG